MEVNDPHFYSSWHFHPQCEIIYVQESTGTEVVGDSIRQFKPGDIVLLGPDLPHIWRNEDIYYKKETKKHARAIVIYFFKDFMGKEITNIPEMHDISELLKKANRGLIFKGQTKKDLANMLVDITRKKGIDRLIHLFNILRTMTQSDEHVVLSSMVYSSPQHKKNFDKINTIYQYILDNFKNKISLAHISAVSNMSPNSFCRYFKSRTGKTFVRFVNEVRIGYAGKLLIENKMNISQICYEVGFENFSNFSRQFREIHGMSPKEYRERIVKKN